MADTTSSIDQIIAGGAGASSRANFAPLSTLLDSFYKGRDQAYQQEGRDLFRGGLPTGPDGQIDWNGIAKTVGAHGDLAQAAAASNLDLERQKLQASQSDAQTIATGGPQINSPPSTNRVASEPVAAPLNKGGVQSHTPRVGSPQGDQPGSIVGLVSAAGVPDELAGPIINQVSAMTKMDPNATLNPEMAPRVQQVIAAAAQRMKGGVQPQPPQSVPQQPQQQTFGNAQATGLIPPGVDPQAYVARLTYIAGSSQSPATQKAAKDKLDAIMKASELTSTQKDYNAVQQNPKIGDWQAQQKADEARATATAQADVKEQQGIIDQGREASTRLQTLNTVANIVQSDKSLTLGFGGETALKMKKALQQLGIDMGDLSGAQTIEKLNASLASEAAKSVSPRPAQFEFKTFLNNNPGLSLDKAGNLRVIGIFSQLAKRDVDLGRLARASRDNWDNWDTVVQNYDKQHPILDPVTHSVLSTDSVIAPASKQGSGTQSNDHPEGTVAHNPKTGQSLIKSKGKWVPYSGQSSST